MIGIHHTTVIFFASLGLFIGVWFAGSEKKITHNKMVMLSLIFFCIFLGIGVIIHYWMDFIPLP